jgi:hypothetical protein
VTYDPRSRQAARRGNYISWRGLPVGRNMGGLGKWQQRVANRGDDVGYAPRGGGAKITVHLAAAARDTRRAKRASTAFDVAVRTCPRASVSRSVFPVLNC